MEQEQTNDWAYKMFKDMVLADPNLDPNERGSLHQCKENISTSLHQ